MANSNNIWASDVTEGHSLTRSHPRPRMPLTVNAHGVRRIHPPSRECQQICQQNQGHVQSILQVTQHPLDLGPVILIWQPHSHGYKGSDGLNVPPRPCAQKQELRVWCKPMWDKNS